MGQSPYYTEDHSLLQKNSEELKESKDLPIKKFSRLIAFKKSQRHHIISRSLYIFLLLLLFVFLITFIRPDSFNWGYSSYHSFLDFLGYTSSKALLSQGTHELRLKHIFHRGGDKFPDLFRRLDFSEEDSEKEELALRISNTPGPHQFRFRVNAATKSIPLNPLHDPSSLYSGSQKNPLHETAKKSAEKYQKLKGIPTTLRLAKVPDPTHNETVYNLGLMTYNAYLDPTKDTWKDIPGWNMVKE